MPEEMKKEAPKAAASSGSDDSKLFGALCYIIGVLVPLFVLFTEKKENKFLAFHAWQSLIFSALWIVAWVGLSVISSVASIATGGIGSLLFCLFLPLGLIVVVGVLFSAWKAYQGEKYKLPIIGDFAEKQVK